MIGEILRKVENTIKNVSETRNFEIPVNKVVQFYGAKKLSQKNIVRDEHTGLYIGKMIDDEDDSNSIESIYTDDALSGMLAFAYKHSNKGNINIYLGSMLYEVLAINGKSTQEQKISTLSFERQKERLLYLAKKAKLPKGAVSIHSLYDNHKELFDYLKENDIHTLGDQQGRISDEGDNTTVNTQEPPISSTNHTTFGPQQKSLSHDTSSLEIARYLYQITQTNAIVKEKMLSLIPQGLSHSLSEQDPLTYYGLLECAIRIKDVMNGITTQGGIIRQKKYDDVMLWLLSGKTHIPEVDTIFGVLGEELEPTFARRYFKNDVYNKLRTKEEEKHNLQARARNITIAISTLLAGILGGGIGMHKYMIEQEKKQQAERGKQQEIVLTNKYIGDEKIGSGWKHNVDYNYYNSPEKKAELLTNTTNNIYTRLKNYYSMNPEYENSIKGLIKSSLLEQHIDINNNTDYRLTTVNSNNDRPYDQYKYFCNNYFFPKYKKTLEIYGCDLRVYSVFLPYKNVLKNTTDMADKIEISNSKVTWGSKDVIQLPNYTNQNGIIHEVVLLKQEGKDVILARPLGLGGPTFDLDNLSLKTGRRIADDILRAREIESIQKKFEQEKLIENHD